MVLRDEEITVRDVKDLALLEPYGCENPVPVFAYRGARIKNYRIVGAKANHLIFDVARGDSERVTEMVPAQVPAMALQQVLALVAQARDKVQVALVAMLPLVHVP